MGINPLSLPDALLLKMDGRARKSLGPAGITAQESLHRSTTLLEREIHNQFIGFLKRFEIAYWHSNPVRKSSIGEGLPDFLCWRGGRAIAIEFKVAPNTLSKVQEEKIAWLRALGNEVHVCEENAANSAYEEATRLLTKFFEPELTPTP